MYPVTLTGPRLTLREFRSDDLDASMAVVGDEEVVRTLSFDVRDRDTQAERLAQDIARARTSPRPEYYLAVTDSTDTLIGFARMGLGRDRSGELGYAIRHEDWGKGYATEAATLMIDFGFKTLNLHRIRAACGPGNHTSQRLLARLGFTPDGRIRNHVFTDGAWRDSVLYSLPNPEKDGELVREYVGTVKIQGQPKIHFRVFASSLDEARASAVERHGEGIISVWNEEDARRTR
ncbi:GNAT family N-acetyltransferase [Actinoplanes hulinensis]|uniref:GNAT family N-acetyltransferase n=1 Tax=Actinoplanes hulinensis TaxID=1144547 RepID=A0ABS7B0I4_9ACTN|nr:GNAT family N-acetyltransferase [Actinoplanes hulinensis]MBW6434490.1 GNAT family N-acetyltransferase [Actinoplanes hulinensis]